MSSRLNEDLSRYSALCEERMHDILDVVDTSEINRESMSYSLFAGGKRLSPALCLASCEMLGGRAEDAVSAWTTTISGGESRATTWPSGRRTRSWPGTAC